MAGSGIEENRDGFITIPNDGTYVYLRAQQENVSLVNLQDDYYSSLDPSSVCLLPQKLSRKASHQLLPHLSIPLHSTVTPIPSETPESETPVSLNSPLIGIVDLSSAVKTTESAPVTHGGFSDIYKAEWERTLHDDGEGNAKVVIVPVAVKLLRVLSAKDHDGVKARKRLNREVYVWHRLDHPNIATFFGTSYHMAGRPAMVMQWYANGSATDYLRHKNPDIDRLRLILDVARGLEYLHTLKPPIVHGDLKGNNVLIADDGHAVLSDFGLSQVIDELVGPTGWTLTNPDIGPVRWQAPELLIDENCHPSLKTDVWSFGCTAYELLTGHYPYHHRSRDSVIIQDIQAGMKPAGPEDIKPLHTLSSVWDIIDACWAFNPSDRLPMVEIVSKLEALY